MHIISNDEKMGIQAIERSHEIHPAIPGKHPERVEYSYDRHGTLCLIANFEVATGKVIAPTIGPTRTQEDYLEHIKQTVETDNKGKWIFITDQLNTHKSESLVKWVAAQCNVNIDRKSSGKPPGTENPEPEIPGFTKPGCHDPCCPVAVDCNSRRLWLSGE